MTETPSAPSERRVRVYSQHGTFDGTLRVGPRVRTLDDLNVAGRRFLTVHDPVSDAADWPFGPGPLAVNTASVLLVAEVSDFRPTGEATGPVYARAPMTLRVGDLTVRGFVHVPSGGDPFKRLNQESRPFLALTSAAVLGPSAQFAAAFVAVNRAHVALAGGLPVAEPLDAEDRETCPTR